MLRLFRHVNSRFSTLRLNKYKNIVTISERANNKLEDIIGSRDDGGQGNCYFCIKLSSLSPSYRELDEAPSREDDMILPSHGVSFYLTSGGKVVYLRLTLKGCNGYTYDMKLREKNELDEMDERIYGENGKLLLVIENKASFYLLGSHIDHQTTELSDGFTFNNPNIISVCGCGQSFQLNNSKEAE